MKKTLAAIATTLSLAAPAGLAAPAAAADTTCTKSDYRKIHKGDSYSKVKRLCGKGKRVRYSPPTSVTPASQVRDFKTPDEHGNVSIVFKKKRNGWIVDSKYAYWG